jgi:S1-C subfamily serine protease
MADQQAATVTLTSGQTRQARVVAQDDLVGLSVLQVEPGGLVALPWAQVEPAVGEDVFAVGAVYGLGPMVTWGIVAAPPQALPGENDWGFDTRIVLADLQVHRGAGGGALLDVQGQVIGVLMAQYGGVDGATPLGVALLGSDVRPLVDQLGVGVAPTRGWIGVDLETLFGRLVITGVVPDSPAAGAGLETDDVIVSVDGASVTRAQLFAKVARATPGTRLSVVVSRESDAPRRPGRAPPPPQQITLEILVAARP